MAPAITIRVARDAPFHDAFITREVIDGLTKFAKGFGLIKDVIPYEVMVATEFSLLWKE